MRFGTHSKAALINSVFRKKEPQMVQLKLLYPKHFHVLLAEGPNGDNGS